MSLRQEMTRVEGRSPLDGLLLGRLRSGPEPPPHIRAKVALDISDGDSWTLGVHSGRLSLSSGVDPDADTTIFVASDTLVDILEGERSGIHAFLTGDLRVRGNLALSLRLGTLVGASEPARFERSAEITAAGMNTFYLEAGQGPPVVLLHGLGATNASMLPTFWELARDHRVIAPDLPGFGDSSKPIRSDDAAFYARWAAAFLDELGIECAFMIGNSMGGRVAIEAALAHPERVERLALLAPSPAFLKKREMVGVVRLLRPELALVPVPLPRALVLRNLKAMFARPERLEDAWYQAAVDEFLRVFSTPRGRIAFFSAARQIYLEEPHGDSGFWDRLPGLSRPALFVWGDHDRLVPASFARHVQKAVPEAESVVLDGCGHVPQFELPDRTHALVRDFFDA